MCKPEAKCNLPNSQERNQCASYAHILYLSAFMRLCVSVCLRGGRMHCSLKGHLRTTSEGDKNFLSYFQMKNNPTQNAASLC